MSASSRDLDRIVAERIARSRDQIEHSIRQIAAGNPLGAEPEPERRVERLQAKGNMMRPQAEMLATGIAATAARVEATTAVQARAATPGTRAITDGREAIWGSTLDFVGIEFFGRGRRAADAVARVAWRDGRAQGTGFVVAPGLFLTNHHVVESPTAAGQLCLEFDYEIGVSGETLPVSRFGFDPARCFVTDGIDGLDFTLIGIGARIGGTRPIESFGHVPLSDATDKHMLGEVANIIQHPQGRLKEVVLRENQLVARDDLAQVLHYIADTEPGASGSPVFNNQWQAIALHHWGGPWIEDRDATGARREINEGIRISAVVRALAGVADSGGSASARAVAEALALWRVAPEAAPTAPPAATETPSTGTPRIDPDGRVTWTIPLELSLRLPGLATPAAAPPPVLAPAMLAGTAEARVEEDFSDRGGYEPGFLPGLLVPLPLLAADHVPARNIKAAADDNDPFELRYHHFSIKMNAARRLAYFTACNIDGTSLKSVNRSDKSVTPADTPDDLGVESIGAEASDDFRPDRRIPDAQQNARDFYAGQIIPGHPDTNSGGRIARMFQKGHITLRGDPAWGLDAMAVAAERDTFFYTNAAPQIGFFNQGSGLDRPGQKGKLRWRAVESYVLRNALTMRRRVTVFAGPIFADDDRAFRGVRVPMRFWKIALWVEDGVGLRSVALVADQSKVIEVWPEDQPKDAPELEPVPEAFDDPDELARVSEFLTSVAAIEAATGLDFGDDARAGDIRAGATDSPAIDAAAAELFAPPRPRARRRRGKRPD